MISRVKIEAFSRELRESERGAVLLGTTTKIHPGVTRKCGIYGMKKQK